MTTRKIAQRVTTEHGAYILVAIVGFVSAIVSLFFDINSTVSVKWVIFLIILLSTSNIILVRIIASIASVKRLTESIRIIKYYRNPGVLLVKCNLDISPNTLLTIYHRQEKYEVPYAIGVAENVQENGLVSVRIIKRLVKANDEPDLVRDGLVKTSLLYSKLNQDEQI